MSPRPSPPPRVGRRRNAVGDLESSSRARGARGTPKELTEQQQPRRRPRSARPSPSAPASSSRPSARRPGPAKAQWKQATAELDALFARWQRTSRTAPPAQERGNELWKRFRAARSTIEHAPQGVLRRARRRHRDVAHRKQALVERAEALAPAVPTPSPTTAAARRVEARGRAGKKVDDALWAKFKAAGDVLFRPRPRSDAQEDASSAATSPRSSRCSTRPRSSSPRPTAGRASADPIQRSWDEIGKVPRDQVRPSRTACARSRPRASARGRALAARGPREEGALRRHARPAAGRDRKLEASSPRRGGRRRSAIASAAEALDASRSG
jgi:hypothetical protein